jgi:hypothetical protein
VIVNELLDSIKRKRVDKECKILDAAAAMVVRLGTGGASEFQFRIPPDELKAAFRRH